MGEETMSAFAPPKANLEGGAAVAGAQRVAERGTRLAAILLDAVVALPLGILVAIGMFVGRSADGQPGTGFTVSVSLAVLLGLALLIFQMYLLSTTGQTLGKKWMKIRIVKLDGSLPGFVHAVLLRMWVNGLICAVPYLGSVYWLVDTLFVFRDDRRCIHDLIASTRVIVAE